MEFPRDLTAFAQYGVSPDRIESISRGTYRIAASTSEGESNHVIVDIIKSENVDSIEREIKLENAFSYYLTVGDHESSQKLLDEMFKINPQSVRGHISMGRLCEARGDLDRASEAYVAARNELISQNPDTVEPPRALDVTINLLSVKIKRDE